MPSALNPSRAETLLAVLEREGVTHAAGLPDNATAPLIDRLMRHPTIRWVPVTREGEAFAVAAGLWIGGMSPVVLVQNTGLLESGDSVRGTILRMAVPLVVIVSGRGFAKLRASGIDPRARPFASNALTRPDIDSAALLTEATLEAWGLPIVACEGDDVAAAATAAFERVRRGRAPVALLLTAALA